MIPFRYWCLLFYSLDKPSSLSLSLKERCSSPLIILMILPWTCSNSSTPFLSWGIQAWRQYAGWGLTKAKYRRTITSLDIAYNYECVTGEKKLQQKKVFGFFYCNNLKLLFVWDSAV